MASTAHKTSEEITEFHDSKEELDAKIDELVKLIKKSKYMVSWTGAGVSTSCGIPDFRGPNGKWTLEAQKKQRDPSIKVVNSLCASPSPTHLGMVGLLEKGYMKKVISSNTDGLHRRSGIHVNDIAELHGNGNKARCNKCGAYFMLDQRVRQAAKAHCHETGCKCLVPGCQGELCDTIINFGEYLYTDVSTAANSYGGKADVLLVLGTSLRVMTCDACEDIQKNGTFVIVNLQKTPYDSVCDLRIFATTDEVMQLLYQKMNMTIPNWILKRYLTVQKQDLQYTFQGTDELGTPYTFLQQVDIAQKSDSDPKKATPIGKATVSKTNAFNPLMCTLPKASAENVAVCHTFGHRGEPPFCVPLDSTKASYKESFQMFLDMTTGVWTVTKM